MKDPLVRFGVAIEQSLLRQFDALVEERGGTRSELLRYLARREVGRAKVAKGVDAVCTLTPVVSSAGTLTRRASMGNLSSAA